MKNRNTPVIETERLLLRKFTERDFKAIFKIYSDEEVNQFLPWFPLKTIDQVMDFWQEKYHAIYQHQQAYRYAICLKTDNVPIGYVNVSMDDSHDLGYGLLKEFWHKGITSEACKAIIEQVKADGILYITATHDIRNIHSGGVMIKLGMKYQYSYEEQWQPKDKLVTFRLYQLNFDSHQDRVYQKYWNHSPVHFIENKARF